MTTKKIVGLMLFVLLALVTVFLIIFALNDTPPPEDADLRITFEKIPDEQNAFTAFNLAVENLSWPENSKEEDRLTDLLKDDGWDQALADDILAQNEGLFDTIERGLACPRCQFPEGTRYSTPLPYLSPLRTIARLGAIRAEHLFRQGKQKEALEQAMQVIRLGARMQNGRGCIITYLVGVASKEIGHRPFRRMLATTTLAPEHLMPYIERLEACRASEEGLADVYRVEYMCAVNTVDDVAGGGLDAIDLRGIRKHVLRRLPFKPNKTKRLFAEAFRIHTANISRTYSEATFPERSESTPSTAKLLTSGNAVGIILYHMIMPALDRVTAQKCRENCSVAATQILIALKCHTLETGELPDSLDELVPEYFDALPLDDFDGKPMKYSKQNKVIYAVGTDLEDNGGIAKDDREGVNPDPGYDLIFKIKF